MIHTIKNDRLEVKINSLGAELVSVKCDGSERLWQNESGVWSGHAPILFPFAGACKVKLDGVEYKEHRRHGFARCKEFCAVKMGGDFIRFALQDDAYTMEYYPYHFELQVEYRLKDNEIEIRTSMKNNDAKTLYYSIGGHESYALEKKDYMVRFPENEIFDTLMADENGLMTGAKASLGEGKVLPLKKEYFAGGKTLIFADLNSESAELCTLDGAPIAKTVFSGYPYFLIWSPDGADMVCLEPWCNLPDNTSDNRELSEKGFIAVEPNEKHFTQRKLIYY